MHLLVLPRQVTGLTVRRAVVFAALGFLGMREVTSTQRLLTKLRFTVMTLSLATTLILIVALR
ncbi:Uncharacterised protein [Streptococcus equi subsp. equi]|nr:Uncharacterised protein [Streptococcus equi subsp. equi]